MFWIKTIRKIQNEQNDYWDSILKTCQLINNINERINPIEDKIIELETNNKALMESNETYLNRFVEINKDIEAISAVLASDRKDINAIIQLVKKSTKGKK